MRCSERRKIASSLDIGKLIPKAVWLVEPIEDVILALRVSSVHLSEKRFFQETPGRAILKKDSPSSKQPDLSKTDLCYPAPNALSAFMGRTASLFFKLNRLETTSRHRSQKGI